VGPTSHVCVADGSKALITRALSEMTRVGKAYGANPLTYLGLAGVGDLILTCSSPLSRNYTVGKRLAAGEKIEYIVENPRERCGGGGDVQGLEGRNRRS
jgi:glycerol-3-phosphate dehydrogenase